MKYFKSVLFAILLIPLILSAQGFYPYNPSAGQTIQTSVAGVSVDRAFLVHFEILAVNAGAADVDSVLAAHTDTGADSLFATGFVSPLTPRNITATAGGTAGDIAAAQVVIVGTDYSGNAITDSLTAFTVNTAGTIQGTLAFKTITSIYIPLHDGTGATTSIGYGDKLGIPYKLTHNTVIQTFLGNSLEGTAPTVVTSSSAISQNTVDLNSALDGTNVDIYLIY